MQEQILDNDFYEPDNVDMQTARFAGFWIRVAASVIDSLVFIPIILLGFWNLTTGKNLMLELVISFAWIFYKVFMEYRFQATVGKMAMKIKVVNEVGDGITLEQSIVRFSFYFMAYAGAFIGNYYLFKHPDFLTATTINDVLLIQEASAETISSLSNFPILISVVFVAFDLKRQALHDKLAKTYCIYDESKIKEQ